jgi:hypothetical protein
MIISLANVNFSGTGGGGGTDVNAQHRLTAETYSAMTAMTGVSEGDICVVVAHYSPFPDEFYESYLPNDTFRNCLQSVYTSYHSPTYLRLTLVESEYAEEGAPDAPAKNAVQFYARTSNSSSRIYGFKSSSKTVSDETVLYYAVNNGSVSSFSGFNIQATLGYQLTVPLYNLFASSTGLFYESNFKNAISWSGATGYKYVWYVEYYLPTRTYQFNNGSWIELGDASVANEALANANSALSGLGTKLDYIADTATYPSVDEFRSQITQDQSCLAKFVTSEGTPAQDVTHLMIHKYDSSDARNNPVVDELVQSKSVFDIVALTQAEYDALEQAGELVSTTLYAIIPSNS